MAEPFDRSEFVAGYLAEVEEHLENANGQLLKLELAVSTGEPQLRMTRELFRALHTIKGLSAMVGIEPIVELAHEIEAALRIRGQSASPLAKAAVETLFRGVRAIATRVRAFAQQRPVEPAPKELLSALQALQLDHPSAVALQVSTLTLAVELTNKLDAGELAQLTQGVRAGLVALRVDFSPAPDKAARGLSITSVRERVSKLAEIVKVVPQAVAKSPSAPTGLTFVLLVLTQSSPEAIAEAAGGEGSLVSTIELLEPEHEALEELTAEAESETLQHDTIRVEVSRLDDALEKLGALVVTRFRLDRAVRELRASGADVRPIEAILSEHRRELKHLRGSLTRARMVSMQQLLERVPLLVRGMARDSGKQVQLTLDAKRAELDKAVAERIFPALLHLIRNAVDHAIEPVELRRARGKPEHGTITVRCSERAGNQLELTVSDDGGGIDRERVARKANQPVPSDDRVLLELITRPGLSTVEQANARSGRGMGMDIVKRVAVDLLGGQLSLHSERDVGSTFTLRLPMSISILDSFTFRCGPQSFVVPLAMVDEIVELEGEQVLSAPVLRPGPRDAKLLRRRGEDIPLFELATFFALTPAPGLRSALVVRREREACAFSVDHMLGQQEVVVRPLEDPLVKVAGVTGSTDLGDGLPTLVVDLWALSRLAPRETSRTKGRA